MLMPKKVKYRKQQRGRMTGKAWKGGELAFFRDPDGNELSLWQYDHVEAANELVKLAEIRR